MESDLMQMETWIAQTKTRIHSAAIEAMTEIGGLATDSLIQRLNNPYPPASVAGEDPHRRSGQLSAGVQYKLEDSGGLITVYLISSRETKPMVPFWLEHGTQRMGADGGKEIYMAAREYMLRTEQEWQRTLPETFSNLFFGRLAA